MTLRPTVAVAVVAVLVTAGCTGRNQPTPAGTGVPQATNHPTSTAPASTPPAPDAAPRKFGARFTYQDGLVIQLGRPTRFHPSQYAVADKAPAYVAFQVTVINDTTTRYDPTMCQVSVQSSNTESGEVIDLDQGFNGSPSTVVLPHREATFKVGFAVQNPTDLVAQVTPGFDYDPAVFTS